MPWDNEIWAPCRLGEKFEYIDLGNRRNGWLLSVSADWMGGRGDHCAVNRQEDLLKPHGGYNVKIGLGPRPWSKCLQLLESSGLKGERCTLNFYEDTFTVERPGIITEYQYEGIA